MSPSDGAPAREGRLPSLAVVVPTLDEEESLPALLASLLGAGADPRERPDELLVVDGGSRDATLERAREQGIEPFAARSGRGAQMREGARRATSDVLLFLHADTRVAPGALVAVRRAFASGEVVATGMRQRIDHPGWIYRWIERAADLRVRLGRVYGDSGLAVRRADYEAVGGFRELPLFEDLDLSRRLRRRGPVRLVPGARLTISPRRWQREGALRRTVRNWLLTAAWSAGVDPSRLVRYYPPHSTAAGGS